MYVEKNNTKFTVKELANAWATAYTCAMTVAPSKEAVVIICAQWALETGRGAACWNYNIGNIRGEAPDGGFTVLKGAWEVANNGSIVYPANQKFRAYKSIDDGCADYVHVLSTQHNFAIAWRHLAGPGPTPSGYAHALKQGHYYTGDEAEYAKSLVSLYREYIS